MFKTKMIHIICLKLTWKNQSDSYILEQREYLLLYLVHILLSWLSPFKQLWKSDLIVCKDLSKYLTKQEAHNIGRKIKNKATQKKKIWHGSAKLAYIHWSTEK